MHSTEPATHRAAQSGERLHNDLYGGGGTLPGVGGYRYGSVVIDDASRMRFPIVLKTKVQICDELPMVIKRIEIHTGRNPIFQQRSKHIAVTYHYTRDLIEQKEIKLEFKSPQDMIADGLTKPPGRVAFRKFVELQGLTNVEAATSKVEKI